MSDRWTDFGHKTAVYSVYDAHYELGNRDTGDITKARIWSMLIFLYMLGLSVNC